MANIIHSKHFTNYVIIAIGYVATIAIMVWNFIDGDVLFIDDLGIALALSQLAGLYLLITSGTFKRTRFYRYARIGIAIILIGALLKIMHYYGGEIAVILGYVWILGCYTLSFIKKPYKKILDWLKLIYAFVVIIQTTSTFLHYAVADYLQIHFLIMLVMVILHIKEQKELGYPEDVNDNFSL
ncbi:MAG: hypothetical protein ACSHWW_13535 [Nonlabens sp.]|uniref:hypothetical protein n=1 Tax=Nonlabens sp. TaxID=1888209 RepID=UPI003EF54881